MSRRDNFRLTPAEWTALQQGGVSSMVSNFASKTDSDMDRRVSAYRKIAAAARAEREAIQEVVLCELAREQISSVEALRAKATEAESQIAALERQNDQLRRKNLREIAAPAMAVNGE